MTRRDDDDIEQEIEETQATQWHKFGDIYFPAKPTVSSLPPGYYNVFSTYNGLRFEKVDISTTGIFLTGSPNAHEIIADIDTFWDARALFDEYEFPYKRGVFLSGPPGSGKTCIIKLAAQKLIKRGGALLDVGSNVGIIASAVKEVRTIHPAMPLIIVMEDVDRWLPDSGPQYLMNTMDGITAINGVLFVATANCTDDLDDAIMDRPGRFDVHYKIMPPRDDVRRDFITRSLRSRAETEDIDKWTRDTNSLSFGHIKELVVSVVVFGKDYSKTLGRLMSMREGQNEDAEESDQEFIEQFLGKAKQRTLRKAQFVFGERKAPVKATPAQMEKALRKKS